MIRRQILLKYDWLYKNFLKNHRGATRLKALLENFLLKKSVRSRGITIHLNSRKEAKEMNKTDIIQGYTKKRGISSDDLVLDVGGYPGEFAIYCAKKGAEVIVCEADEENLRKMRKNFERNEVDVEIIEKAVWRDCSGVGFISDGFISRIDDGGDEVETFTLQKLIQEHGCFDFVKMDVEGAEVKIIEEFLSSDVGCRPFFSIASYHSLENGESSEILEKLFEENRYQVSTGFPDHKTTWAKPE